jgi:uncharacterized protein YxjI
MKNHLKNGHSAILYLATIICVSLVAVPASSMTPVKLGGNTYTPKYPSGNTSSPVKSTPTPAPVKVGGNTYTPKSPSGSTVKTVNGTAVLGGNTYTPKSPSGSTVKTVNGTAVLGGNTYTPTSPSGSTVKTVNGTAILGGNTYTPQSPSGSIVKTVKGTAILGGNTFTPKTPAGSTITKVNGTVVLGGNTYTPKSPTGSTISKVNGTVVLGGNTYTPKSPTGSTINKVNGVVVLGGKTYAPKLPSGSTINKVNGIVVLGGNHYLAKPPIGSSVALVNVTENNKNGTLTTSIIGKVAINQYISQKLPVTVNSLLKLGDENRVVSLSGNSGSVTYLTKDHGTAYSRWEMTGLKDGITKPSILIHVDAHPDMNGGDLVINKPSTIPEAQDASSHISSFNAQAILNNLINEIYWVIPRNGNEQAGTRTLYTAEIIHKDSTGKPVYDSSGNIVKTTYSEFVYPTYGNVVDASYAHNWDVAGQYPLEGNKFTVENLKQTSVHVTYVENLPNLKNQQAILSIDEDYFVNEESGSKAHSRKFVDDTAANVKTFTRTLNSKGINPYVTTISLSPDYTPTDLMGTITQKLISGLK